MTTAVVVLGVLLLLLVYGVSVYNRLVQIKHNVSKAWSNIDVLLKQRHDELPKLIETCSQFKEFEQATLQRVIEARARVHQAREAQDISALGAAESDLKSGLGQIFAVAEAYPDLKSNENFHELMTRITNLEGDIADRRELYNETVNINNVRIEQFPDAVVAGMFDFPRRPLLAVGPEERRDVDVKRLFG
jgi:LemA protein